MTRNTSIVALTSLVFVVVASLGLVWVLYTVTTAGDTLQEHITTIANNDAKEKAFADLSALVAQTASIREELKTFVLTEENTSVFLTDIESLGVAQGVKLTTNSLDVKRQSGMFDLLTIKFTIEGQETAVQKMINIFETLPYYSQVVALSLSKDGAQTTKSDLELTVTVLKHDK